jgi:selenocysteine lyase/cysteine desulfurase
VGKNPDNISRRRILGAIASTSMFSFVGSAKTALTSISIDNTLRPSVGTNALNLAKNEDYWRKVASYYDKTDGITNLEHGYWGKMASPVQNFYIAATRMVNGQNSFYARKDYKKDLAKSVQRVAAALGVAADEIVLTRNATEAMQNLIRQYRGLKAGHTVLYADIDYPTYKKDMVWLKQAYGVNPIEIELPVRANQKDILDMYIATFNANPGIKMMLVTHVSNQHGMKIPVREISIEARKRGIDVISDNAQSWGLLDYKMNELDVDFAVFNLHKWIGSPVGVGALYIKKSALHKIAPYMGEKDDDNTKIESRVHVATANFAAMITIPMALDFHEIIGAKNKQARLNYLRDLWVSNTLKLKHIEVLGGTDEASRTGMGSFRIRGKNSIKDAKALQLKIEKEFGVFTVVRKGLSSGGCVRVTPQVFNTPDQIKQLVSALNQIDKSISS